MYLRFGGKGEECSLLRSQFRLQLMGEPALRCRACGGKFGQAGPAGTCELCWYLERVTEHLKSPRFPVERREAAICWVKECYFKVLDTAEVHWGSSVGAPGDNSGGGDRGEEGEQPKTEAEIALEKAQDLHPPRAHQEVEEKPEEKSEVKKDKSCLNLTAKAVPKPPVRAKEEEPSESEPKESEAASGSRPEGGEGHRRRHRRHREKSSRKDRSEDERSRTRSLPRRRRTSGETGSSPRVSRRKVRDSSPLRGEDRRRARPSRRPSEPRRESPKPRPPPGPPPIRGKWVGPILARRRGEEENRERSKSRKSKNKGLKKKAQQAKVRSKGKGKGGWFRR